MSPVLSASDAVRRCCSFGCAMRSSSCSPSLRPILPRKSGSGERLDRGHVEGRRSRRRRRERPRAPSPLRSRRRRGTPPRRRPGSGPRCGRASTRRRRRGRGAGSRGRASTRPRPRRTRTRTPSARTGTTSRRHRHPSLLGDARRLAVRTRAAARELHREVHDRGVDPQGHEAGHGRPATGPSTEDEERPGDAEPQLRAVGQAREPPQRLVERRGRRARDRAVDRTVDLGQLVEDRGRGRAPRRGIGLEAARQAFLGRVLRGLVGDIHALMVAGHRDGKVTPAGRADGDRAGG